MTVDTWAQHRVAVRPPGDLEHVPSSLDSSIIVITVTTEALLDVERGCSGQEK